LPIAFQIPSLPLNVIVPRHNFDTSNPVFPNVLYCIQFFS
jgi:hypothetical protein